MPVIPINQVGEVGIIKDLAETELPANVWTHGENVRMRRGSVAKFLGHQGVYDGPEVPPLWLLQIKGEVLAYWIYCGLNKVWITDQNTHINITRQTGDPPADDDYSANPEIGWNGGILGGVPILNNGINVPQSGDPLNPTDPLEDLPNWPSDARAKMIRIFREYAVALNVEQAGDVFPQMVWWSHPAEPGQVPPDWDFASTTSQSGRFSLSETAGHVLDLVPLRGEIAIVYKEDSLWGMQWVGGQFVFRFYNIARDVGLLAPQCAVSFDRGHVFVSRDDVKVTAGQYPESIVDRRMRRWLFNTMDRSRTHLVFAVPNFMEKEVWVCFPEPGAPYANLALVWSWENGAIGVRDLPLVRHIGFGVVDPEAASDAWEDDDEAWEDDNTAWNEATFDPTARRLLMAVPEGDGDLFVADFTNTFNGVPFRSRIERTVLPTFDAEGVPVVPHRKLITEVWPKMEGSPGAVVDVYVGAQERSGGPITWQGPEKFSIDEDIKVDFLLNGRLIAVAFESNANLHWVLHSFDVNVKGAGRH